MKLNIKESIGNPVEMEKIYRADKKLFEKEFQEVYPEISDNKISAYWKARLDFDNLKLSSVRVGMNDIMFLIIACLLAGLLIEIPNIFSLKLNTDFFYAKNAALIAFLGLSTYAFLIKEKLNIRHILITLSVFILSAIYVNFLPNDNDSHSIKLIYIHLPLMLWCLYGLIFIDFNRFDKSIRVDYLKHNGDLAILIAVLIIAGGILTLVTFQLFSVIDVNIEKFYSNYVVILGLVSVPILATFITRIYPKIASKIAPVIANIFSPLVLITLVIYLITIAATGKDPYNDRDFLLVFNLMLLGVMGIIVFSISEASTGKRQRFSEMTLFILSIVTLIIDLIALSAIIYRIGEFGFTPNKTAVLGSNLLIFINLLLITIDLFKVNFKSKEIGKVEKTIADYLLVYALWTVFMVFILPIIFGFK